MDKFSFVFLSLFTVHNTNNNSTNLDIIDNIDVNDNYNINLVYIISSYLFTYSLLLFGAALATDSLFKSDNTIKRIILISVALLALFHLLMCMTSLYMYNENKKKKKHYVLLYWVNIAFSVVLLSCALYEFYVKVETVHGHSFPSIRKFHDHSIRSPPHLLQHST